VLELQRLTRDHLDAVLSFELENRAWFGWLIDDRGDEFFASFPEHHDVALAQQAAGECAFYVLVDGETQAIVGRFNLYRLQHGAATVGYRVAEDVAGRGVATRAVRDLCRIAADDLRLDRLNAETSRANAASQRVLQKAGFAAVGECTVAGKPGLRFARELSRAGTR
jgi:RimJ/RimL family protein N-acetyltransferase